RSWLLAATSVLCALALPPVEASIAQETTESEPQTVTVTSGKLRLTGLLFKPAGPGRFPAILFAHGSGPTDPTSALDVGPVFAGHGYLFLYLFRRGDGLSARQGAFLGDVLARERERKGEEARNRLQLKLLTTDHLNDVLAGVAYLRTRSDVEKDGLACLGRPFCRPPRP